MLEQAYAASDQQFFLSVLYTGIKSAAQSICIPKVATAEDAAASLSSQAINETSSEAELVEYKLLLESIFGDFERFIANAHISDSDGVDITSSYSKTQEKTVDVLHQLADKLSFVCPRKRAPCGRIFEEQEPTFRCKYVSLKFWNM